MRGATAYPSTNRIRRDDFNPRSPCGERRGLPTTARCKGRFQSTLPMRGATKSALFLLISLPISIHAPHAGSDDLNKESALLQTISIHAPHAGSDNRSKVVSMSTEFQSTLPMRGATYVTKKYTDAIKFQSTLPMRGATMFLKGFHYRLPNFNPRSPCGERLGGVFRGQHDFRFQSTLPMRGATPSRSYSAAASSFQSTLPMRGATGVYKND